MSQETETNQQATLWGGYVEAQPSAPLDFIKVHEEVVNDGDTFSLSLNAASYNEDKQCLTVIDSDKNKALTVYFEQHPESKFESTPNGVRFARAIQRCLRLTINDGDELAQTVKDQDLTLTVTHMGSKGRLWTIAKA